jgi:hypothetical protein
MLFTILFSMLVTALALMLAFPKTPTARAVHRVLVETPAEALFDMTWKKATLNAVVVLAFVVFALMGPEMMMMFAAMGADAAAVELMIIVFAASAMGGLGSAWRVVTRVGVGLSRIVTRISSRSGRARAARRPKSRPHGRKDDASGPDWAFA